VGVINTEAIFPLTNTSYIDKAAAVIIEPIVVDVSEQRLNWLKILKKRCTESGCVLIFDETITGFRFPKLSFSNWSGIRPDISIMGKALANGMPISVVGGSSNIMDADYFVSSTFAGEQLTLLAAKTTMEQLSGDQHIDGIYEHGTKFMDLFNELDTELVELVGYGTRGVFKAKDDLTLALFFQESAKAGILFCNSWFFTYDLIGETYTTISICKNILTRIKNEEVSLEGKMPVKPYALKERE